MFINCTRNRSSLASDGGRRRNIRTSLAAESSVHSTAKPAASKFIPLAYYHDNARERHLFLKVSRRVLFAKS